MKKDKQKVVDEVWTEERIQSFLDLEPPPGEDRDFHTLYTAYKSMRLEDFETFLDFYANAGRNFQARNQQGEQLTDIIAEHRTGREFAQAIERHCQ